ncbi:MAG: hypothetical protein QFX34_04740 [Candidatus Verstraetearchaeota archaeon]|nr:hypothetical protein [Candidatus Verstraetearchaeota archaeon]
MCGLSGALSAVVGRRVFKLGEHSSLLVGLVGGLNIIAIGSTQQWHRHMLGTVCLLAYLAGTGSKRDLERLAPLVLMAMAYEPTAMLASVLSAYHALKSQRAATRASYALVAAASVALLVWYMRVPIVADPITGISIMGVIDSGFPDTTIDLLIWGCVFFLPLAPSILLIDKVPGSYRLLIAILAIAVIQPAIMPYNSMLEQHRWASMSVFVLVPAAIAGYSLLDKRLLAAFSVAALLIGAIYAAVPDSDFYLSPLSGSWKYRAQRGFPWELEPVMDSDGYSKIRAVSETLAGSTKPVLLSWEVYPWIHLDIRNPKNFIGFGYGPYIDDVVRYMNKSGVSCVYVVTAVDLKKNLMQQMNLPQLGRIELNQIISGKYSLYEVRLNEG